MSPGKPKNPRTPSVPLSLNTDEMPSRPLELLDLIGSDWPVQHHASASLPQSAKSTCRAWANAIWEQLGDRVDGLLAPQRG